MGAGRTSRFSQKVLPMVDVPRFLADHKIGVAVGAAAVIVVGGVAVAGAASTDAATVTAITDGHSIDVLIDADEQPVRLLNVVAPELDTCLAADARDFLEGRIPPGTEVDLEYDTDRHDARGRVLAGVFDGGALINAELARAGLGVAVQMDPNERFYDEVAEAQHEAEEAGRGLWSDEIACTLPAQVREYGELVAQLEGQIGAGSSKEIDGWAAEAATVAAAGAALASIFDGDASSYPLLAYAEPRWTLRDDLDAHLARVTAVEEQLDAERRAEQERIAEEERRERAEKERQEREEQERREREDRERQEREEQERREREEREAEERRAAEQAAQERESAERRAAEEREAQRAEEERQSSSSSGGVSGPFKNCDAARAAGAAPVYAGDPGYGTHLDRDRDGIGCE